MAGVGTSKVFEDERVVVWHLDLEPGEACEQHTHKLDYVVRIIRLNTRSFWTLRRDIDDC